MSETLFPGYEPVEPIPEPVLSQDQRRTKRQADDVAAGRHPLTRGPLHPLASRHRDAASPKSDPFTCGSCHFRYLTGAGNKRFAKCIFPEQRSAEDYERFGPPRLTGSISTDVRAWWPACSDYSPGDKISADAARWIPKDSA